MRRNRGSNTGPIKLEGNNSGVEVTSEKSSDDSRGLVGRIEFPEHRSVTFVCLIDVCLLDRRGFRLLNLIKFGYDLWSVAW